MTRQEKAEVVDGMLDHYSHLGSLLVSDDESLCRLLTTLEIGTKTTRSATTSSSFLTV